MRTYFPSLNACKVAGLMIVVALTGCSTHQPTFYWGDYEQLVYKMYLEPGSADSTMQIAELEETIQKADAKGLRIAPGIHAHLGYMYTLEGNMAQAKAEFLTEKTLFPESAVLIDGMLSRLEGAKNP
ncbi:DUF4810 domain-containing protein [Marinomonas ostreistagni]|uniref:DUF4810 domain-containing protein n=1 Tax=Marinomonas ostreistagni TaxID=359209 RepID=A0ABS0ZET8_9GAMM|nr:DUF4810 domain-containing protein [Marinomonas ostreistagni]MBJ7552127.1 DUF4810 domain-containing protein [Marinomonas ostreistagni]